MKYIENYSTDPRYNLALEEYVFTNLNLDDSSYVLLWINEPSIIIGKNQNTIEEIKMDFVKENNINVVRRITGGGAVYHDLGNLNFSFILKEDSLGQIDFKKYTIPVLKALEKLGIPCELSGRNDITIEGKKFSGVAQSVKRGRVLNHGTLLFNSELDVLSKALNVKRDKIESKGVKSVSSRVTNIKPYVKEDIDIFEFRELVLKNIFEYENKPVEIYKLTEEDQEAIQKMVEERYGTWEWNFGRSPKFNYKGYKRFEGGGVEVRLQIVKGLIDNCKIYGDFFGKEDIGQLEDKLRGIRYEETAIKQALRDFPVGDYLGRITKEDFLSCMFDN